MLIESTFSLKLIYVLRIDDENHKDCLKIGSTTCKDDLSVNLEPNSPALQKAARNRINEYTQTAATPYTLLYTELSAYNDKGIIKGFLDTDVHKVLENSGIRRKVFPYSTGAKEWFETDVETVKQAIAAIKAGRNTIFDDNLTPKNNEQQPTVTQPSATPAVTVTQPSTPPPVVAPICFRPEQRKAIDQSLQCFKRKKSHQMLWNAKMRFGKTLTALQLVKELGCARTLILTHRPVVNSSWFEEFNTIFAGTEYRYSSRLHDLELQQLEADLEQNKKCRYVYFASMQDLRGSALVGGNFDKNQLLFDVKWDLIIVDEAHEGIRTDIGDKVLKALENKRTKFLYLSGTPFNLQQEFSSTESFTWDYVSEQRAKSQWEKEHGDEPNPYASLPKLKIFTYDPSQVLSQFNEIQDGEIAFSFSEFFRTDKDTGCFVHERAIEQFLDRLSNSQADNSNQLAQNIASPTIPTQSQGKSSKAGKGRSKSNLVDQEQSSKLNQDQFYPFACEAYRDMFKHTLWVVPGVKAASALCQLLNQHAVFKNYKVVNVAGNGVDNEEADNALDAVKAAIGSNPDLSRTITVTCGRLTTGVSVPAWTGVLMLSGSEMSSITSYMQTIFRVQTPAEFNGRMKTCCYVFDFAPDRTLRVLANVAQVSAKAGSFDQKERDAMWEFLNFCPIISVNGSQMKRLNVNSMMEQLKRVYTEQVVHHGFEDRHLYSDRLLHLESDDLELLNGLKAKLGTSSSRIQKFKDEVVINDNNLDQMDTDSNSPKARKEPSPEDLELRERKKQQENAIAILRAVSIRMPLMIYGAELKDENAQITIDNFEELIDDESWNEFMPAGLTKQEFASLKHFYDADIFCAAGRRIRSYAKNSDSLPVEQRIISITRLFATFRNPDKETVLTPWRVVNDHLGRCLGGYVFKTEEDDDLYAHLEQEDENKASVADFKPIQGKIITFDVYGGDSRILEINSKSGLYPLFAAYSIFRTKTRTCNIEELSVEKQREIWDEVLSQNIFVVCRTSMARSITCRTLAGFRKTRVNAVYYQNLVEELQQDNSNFLAKVVQGRTFWKANKELNMKFNAIVGNPPYQILDGGNKASAKPIYQEFVKAAVKLNPNYISMIMPARWFSDGKGLDEFREQMFNDRHLRKLVDYVDSRDCFSNVDIAGGVCYFLWDRNYNYEDKCEFIQISNGNITTSKRDLSQNFIRYEGARSIIEKIQAITPKDGFYSERVSARNPFALGSNVRPLEQGDLTLECSKGVRGAFSSELVSKGSELISKWKVMITRSSSDHAGQGDKNGQRRVLATIKVIGPKVICTDTFIILDAFDSQQEAEAAAVYFKTRLARFLIAQLALVQNLSREKFAYVPLQDFSEHSDIDWSQSVEHIEEQLNQKYHLTAEDIAYVNKLIKPY